MTGLAVESHSLHLLRVLCYEVPAPHGHQPVHDSGLLPCGVASYLGSSGRDGDLGLPFLGPRLYRHQKQFQLEPIADRETYKYNPFTDPHEADLGGLCEGEAYEGGGQGLGVHLTTRALLDTR